MTKMINGAGQKTGFFFVCLFFHKNFQDSELQGNTGKFQMENKICSSGDFLLVWKAWSQTALFSLQWSNISKGENILIKTCKFSKKISYNGMLAILELLDAWIMMFCKKKNLAISVIVIFQRKTNKNDSSSSLDLCLQASLKKI